jgi:hypothetical protein
MKSRGFARAALAVLCASAAATAQQGTGDVLLLTASCANPAAQLRTSGCGAGALTALIGVLPTDAITLTATYLPASAPTGPVPFVLVAGRRECPVAGGPPLYVGLANPSPLVLAGQFGPGALSISMVVPAGALAAGLPLSPAVQSPVVQMAAASCSVPGALVMSGAVQLDVQNVVAGSSSLGAGAAAMTGLQIALTPAHAALGTIDPLGLQVHPGGGDLLTAIATGLNSGATHALTFTSGADSATVPVTFSHFPGFSIASGVPVPGFCVGNAVVVALTENGAPAAPAPGNLLFPVSVAPQPAGVNAAFAPTHVAADFAAPNAYFPVFASQLMSLNGKGFFGPTEAAAAGTVAGLCAGSGCLSVAEFSALGTGGGVVPCPIAAATSSLLMELGTPTAIAAQCGQPFVGGQKPTFGPWAVGVRNVACVDATQSLVGSFPTLFLADLPPSGLSVYPRVVAQKNGAAAARIRVYGADFFHRDPSSATDVAQNFGQPLLSGVALHELTTPAVTFSAPGASAPLNLASRVVFVSDTELEVTVPAGLPVGAYDVRVYNPDGRMASVSSAFEVVPPLTKGDAAPPLTNLFGTGIDLPTTLDGAWLAQVLAAQAQASIAAPVSFGTHPPVLVVANPQAKADSGGLPLGATTIPAEQRKPFELAFLFNTRAADGKPRFFDFEAVDLPAELVFQDHPALSGALAVTLPEMSTAPGYFREITLFGGGVGTGAPPGPDQYVSVRVVVKACAFYLDATTTGATVRPRVRFLAEENYPFVVRSRDLLALDGFVDLSGGALAPNDGGAADAQSLIRERTEYAPAPAGGGLGGRGGVHFARTGISVGVDAELATSTSEGAKVLADASSAVAVVTFNPSPPLIAGEAGHAPSARQLLADAGGLISTSSQTGFSGGGGGTGSGIIGNKVAGGGGGAHADLRPPFATPLLPDVLATAGVPGVNSPAGAAASAYGTPLLAPLAAQAGTIFSEAGRVPTDGRYVFGDAGYSFSAGGVLGGPFPYRAASRFDLPALNAPAASVAGDVAFTAAALAGADFTFPLPLFSGGTGGGGGGGSLAIFVPWISVGGRGGNGGGALVLVADGVLRVGPNGRLRADGEAGRSGSHVFPVPNANVFYPLSLPGSGGGGAGGLIAAYAISDVTFTDATAPGGTVLPPVAGARVSAERGAAGDDVGPASEGGAGGTGRVRLAVLRKATLNPRPASLPPYVAAPFASWAAEFVAKNGAQISPDVDRTYSVDAPAGGALPDPTAVSSVANAVQIID